MTTDPRRARQQQASTPLFNNQEEEVPETSTATQDESSTTTTTTTPAVAVEAVEGDAPVEPLSTTTQEEVETTQPVESTTTQPQDEEPQQPSRSTAAIESIVEPPRDQMGTPALYDAAKPGDDTSQVPENVEPISTTTNIEDATTTTEQPPTTNTTTTAVPSTATTTTKTTSTSKPAPSSLSRIAQLEQRVLQDPLDGPAQLALLHEVEQKGDLERTRETYEKFLTTFPDASQQWINYCDLELAHSNFSQVEQIFSRCLRISTSVELWRFYLSYIRRINPIDQNPSQLELAKQTRSIIANAFEFALGHIGMDRRSGEIWSEFIEFLREGPTRGTWEEQQKMDSLRKAFQRAVQVPLNNVEQIWQDYNAFENGVSKMTAKKFIAELSPSYMTARKMLRELRAQHDALYTPLLPSRPDWSISSLSSSSNISTTHTSTIALEGWKRYLSFEESNPLELDDPGQLQQRVGFAYRKALACLRFYSEVWYLSANYYMRMGRVEEAKSQLQAGISAIPSSLLLSYTLADLEESNPEHTACYTIYDNLIVHLYERISKLEQTVDLETNEALRLLEEGGEEGIKKEDEKMDGEGGGMNGEQQQKVEEEEEEEGGAVEKREKKAAQVEKVKKDIKDKYEGEIEKLKKMSASVWITEMRFARRADGVKPARQVFTKARKSPHLSWQVVEASATMEMYWNDEPKVATNVFELGLKLFSSEADYVLRYLDFLLQQNNANNARALFERTVALIEPAKAKPIWDRMAQYEYEYGDHLAAQKMFQRYSEVYFDVPPPVRFASKYAYPGLEDSFVQDLGPSSISFLSRSQARRGRSPSPRRGRTKRGLSPGAGNDENNLNGEDGDAKRARHGPSPSPAPSSQAGGIGPQGGRAPLPPPRGPPEPAPALNRAAPFMLDPRGDNIAVLPDAVVFFLGLLPPAPAFTGPQLNPVTIMDIIANTILPGSAPGPGLPGERLGVPPRPKPERGAGGGGGMMPGAPPPGMDGSGGRMGYGGSSRRPLSPQRAPGVGGGGYGGGGGGYGGGRRY